MRSTPLALLLIVLGCTPDHPTISLADAAKAGDISQVKLHLYWCRKEGCDINYGRNGSGTPLHWAVAGGSGEALRILLDAGADANASSEAGTTPLQLAALAGRPDLVALLLEAGALVNRRGYGGTTPLRDALAKGHTEVASLLRSHGGIE